MGWVVDLFNYLLEFLYKLILSLVDMIKDVFLWAIEQVFNALDSILGLVLAMFEPIDISQYLTGFPPSVSWMLSAIGIPQCLVIVMSAIGIRLLMQLIPFTRLGHDIRDSGKARRGKSYEAVAYHVIPALKDGRKVITNLTLNIDHFVKFFGEDIKSLIKIVDGKLEEFGSRTRPFSAIEDYQDDWRNEKGQGPLYLIDEAHLPLGRQTNAEILEWYSMHRHYGLDIVVITQNLRKLNRDIKDMIEVTYQCTKATALGSSNRYVRKVRDGSSGDVVNESIRKYEKVYFPFYKSHSQSNNAVMEAQGKDIVPFWKRWPVIGSAVLVPVGLVALAITFKDPIIPETSNRTETKVVVEEVTKRTVGRRSGGKLGPLGDVQFYVTGYAKQLAMTNRGSGSGELVSDLTFFKVYVDIYKGSELLFSSDNIQLSSVGYKIEMLSECVFKLIWDSNETIITCKQMADTNKGIVDMMGI